MEAQHLTKPARNYGIDLLRILSMIMIAVIHVIKRSEISTSLPMLSLSSATIWLLEIAVYGAVDCYALISGYVSYGRNTHKYANLLYLCLQALFYMVISTALMLVFDRQSVGMMDILATLFPFAYNTYWYFTAYFCLFFFLPTLNHLVDTLSKPAMTRLIVLLFTVFSLLPTLFHSDFPYSRDGYSFLWLVVLYLFGAYMRKYGVSFFSLMEGNIIHGGNPVLKWMAGNVVMRQDPAGNIKPDKEKSVEKIDGIVASIMALDRCIRNGIGSGSVYDERGVIAF